MMFSDSRPFRDSFLGDTPLLRSYDFFFDAELVYVCHRLRNAS